MKKIWKLTAWHWRIVRVPFALLCAVYAIQQLALLLLAAADPKRFGYQMAELFQECGQMPLFFVTLYLVALLGASATRIRAKSQQTYTLYTMPFPRWNLWAAQFLLGLFLLVLFTAWQILLYMAAYFPVTLVSIRVASGMVSAALPWSSLSEEFNASPLMQLLVPVKAGSGLALIGLLCVTALQSACMACCHGLRRSVAALIALFGTGITSTTFYLRYHLTVFRSGNTGLYLALAMLLAAAAVLTAVNLLQAAWALKHAESA